MEIRKTALVTGGSARIGRAICEGLAKEGYNVAVHYNASGENAEKVVVALRAYGIEAVAVRADLTNSEETRALVGRVADEVGPLGVLVNNASLFEEDSFDISDEELWDAHFAVHVKAPSMLTYAFASQVSDEDQGLVVNIIDERVWKLTPNFSSYTLSKSALWAATKTMAQKFAPKVRVNAIGPGPTLPSARQSDEDFSNQLKTLPLQTAPDLADFPKTILYYAEMKSVTGQMIALDGGQHIGWQTPDQSLPE